MPFAVYLQALVSDDFEAREAWQAYHRGPNLNFWSQSKAKKGCVRNACLTLYKSEGRLDNRSIEVLHLLAVNRTSYLSHTLRRVLLHLQGMDFTTDKLRSLVRKWQTLIEAYVDVKTTDGYVLRMFCIGFTRRRDQQVKRTCYAQSSQIRQIRKKMVELMTREAAACDLRDLVGKFIPEVIGEPFMPVPGNIKSLTRLLPI